MRISKGKVIAEIAGQLKPTQNHSDNT